MQNYQDLIKKNETEFQDPEQLTDFLDAYLLPGDEITGQEDNLHEYSDGLVPIYDNDIVEEWKNNASCHGQAGEDGLIEGVTDAYKIMQADLYAHYSNQLSEDYNTLINLLDEEEE